MKLKCIFGKERSSLLKESRINILKTLRDYKWIDLYEYNNDLDKLKYTLKLNQLWKIYWSEWTLSK